MKIKLFLILTLFITNIGFSKTFKIDGINYKITDTKNLKVEVIALNSNKKYKGDITIPSTVVSEEKSYSVISLGNNAFYFCRKLNSINLPNSLTSIGNFTFSFCSNLTSIILPNSLTSIGKCTFSFCTGLTSIVLSNSLTSIGTQAFYRCTSLTSITLPNSVSLIREDAFYKYISLS